MPYTKAFKNRAIKLYKQGISAKAVANILKCSDTSVRNWVKQEHFTEENKKSDYKKGKEYIEVNRKIDNETEKLNKKIQTEIVINIINIINVIK